MSQSPSKDGNAVPLSDAWRLDEICLRFEDAWKAGRAPRVEDFLGTATAAERAALLRMLIRLDVHYRRQRGEAVQAAEYLRRFPELDPALLDEAIPPGPLAMAEASPAIPKTQPEAAPSAAATATVSPPVRVPGYDILGELGRGGMAVVYKGRDPDLGRDVAVKVIREELRHELAAVRRFVAEGQVAGQLHHPGCAPVYEAGRLPDQRPYFTMKLVEGRTLAALLQERAAPAHDLPRFLKIFEQICQTLAYAHSKGVIHRDLKPSNTMVGAFGELQLMDWGLAKVAPGRGVRTVLSDAAGARSEAGSVMGTPAYMAPEQARGDADNLDERADVFGLGAILCEVLTGAPPYLGRDVGELLDRAKRADLADAFARLDGSGAEAELVRLAKACLSAAPADRPRDAGTVAAAMTAYLAGVQERLRRAELERAAAEARAEEAQAKARAERRARRMTVAAAAVALLLVGGGTAVGLWYKYDREMQASRRAAEVSEAVRRLDAPLQEARRYREQGHAQEALEAARRAEAMSKDERVPEDKRAAVRDQVAELEQVVADDARAERLLDRVADVLMMGETPNDLLGKKPPPPDVQIADAFRGADLDVATRSDAELIAFFEARRDDVRAELAGALDWWAAGSRRDAKNAELSARLEQLAHAIDPDPVRDELRSIVKKLQLGSAAYESWGELAGPVGTIMTTLDYNRLLEIANNNPQQLPPLTVQFLARLLFLAQQRQLALTLLTRSLQTHPGDIGLHGSAAILLLMDRPPKWAEAAGHLQVVCAFRPGSGCALATCLAMLNREDEAVTLCEELTRRQPDAIIPCFTHGVVLQQLNRPQESEAVLREGTRLHPDSALLWTSLANALYLQKKWDAARDAAAEAVRLDPDYLGAHNNLGLALHALKKYPEAEAEFRNALRLFRALGLPDAGHVCALIHSNLGGALESQKKHAEALAECSLAVGIDDDSFEAHNNRGMALAGLERWQEAEDEFRKALRQKPDQPMTLSNLATALLEQDKVADADAACREALRLAPDLGEAHNTHGLILGKQEKYAEAAEAFRTCLRMEPNAPRPYANLGEMLLSLSMNEKGEATSRLLRDGESAFRDAVRLAPDLTVAHRGLALTLKRQKRYLEAIEEYRTAVDLGPEEAENHAGLAGAYWAADDYERARDEYRKAINLKPDDVSYHLDLGGVYQDLKLLDKAVEEYREAVRLKPDSFEANQSLGMALDDLDRPAEAVEPLRRATELKRDDADAFGSLGMALSKAGRVEEAAAAYQAAARLDPNDADNMVLLTAALRKVGRYREAEDAAERVVRLTPQSSSDFVALGFIRHQRGRFRAAADAYREAIRLNPKEEFAHDLLGNVLQAVGQFEEATAEYKKALEISPGRRGLLEDLAMALRRQGLMDEAQSVLGQLDRELPADSPDRPDLQVLLADLEKLRQFDAALADYIAGTKRPADGDEALLLSELCIARGRYGAAARFHAFAFDSDPEWGADNRIAYSFRAARCAVAAACGAEGTAEERRAFHQQARSWLMEQRARLEAAAADETDSVAREKSADALRLWLETPFFQAVRDPEALAKLPEAEQLEWKQFWADVEALLNKLEAREPKK